MQTTPDYAEGGYSNRDFHSLEAL